MRYENDHMHDFLLEPLRPQNFWTALAALGTLSAVAVALFTPRLTRYFRTNRIEKLIRAEIDGNAVVIRNMRSRSVRSLPDGRRIDAFSNNKALVSHIDLRLWRQYRFELAAERPDAYRTFQSVNRYAETVIDAGDFEPPEMSVAVQTDAASSFVDRYEDVFGESRATPEKMSG